MDGQDTNGTTGNGAGQQYVPPQDTGYSAGNANGYSAGNAASNQQQVPYDAQPSYQQPYQQAQTDATGQPYQQPYQQAQTDATGQPYQQPYQQNSAGPQYQPYQQGAAASQKSHIVAGVLGILLGTLGIHKFYLGYNKEGVIMLCVALLGGAITFGVAALVVEVIGIVEGVIYLAKDQQDFDRIYVYGRQPWF